MSSNATNNMSADDDETADEVKVFRTTDVDEPTDIATSSAELTADKKDIALEADIELQTEPNNQRSAFTQPSAFANFPELPSPRDFSSLTHAILMSPLSPFSPLNPINAMKMSPVAVYAQAAVQALRSSPHFLNAAVAAQSLQFPGFSTPSTMAAHNAFGFPTTSNAFFGSLPTLTTLGGSPLRQMPSSPLSARSTMANASSLGASPLTSVAHGINGISLANNNRAALHKRSLISKLTHGAMGATSSDGSAEHVKTPRREKAEKPPKNHVKKPLNAYMWYMRLNRHRLQKEGQRIQSAVINRRLGEEWTKMSKEEQQEYFVMAEKEREKHRLEHPDWTARDNYAVRKKNKKKIREKSNENNDQKKCRAKFGVDNMDLWCKHCRRKKRCLNVRRVESPHVTSTTTSANAQLSMSNNDANLQQQFLQQQMSGGASSTTASSLSAPSSAASSMRHAESPSSSTSHGRGGAASVGKRTESNASSASVGGGFDQNTPPPVSSNTSFLTPKAELSLTSGYLTPLSTTDTNNQVDKDGLSASQMPKPTPTHHLNPPLLPPLPPGSAFPPQFLSQFSNPFAAAAAFHQQQQQLAAGYFPFGASFFKAPNEN